ncbi:hypothetical protein P168DRAFT_293965 [Aspergillus campestris IBT 28561]|uniref:Pre-mRNA-processing protein 45 n=1 Tax=Aspergillus campestris (strain IBT 28561) TaxID=1392248 RepID=A0A2I1CQ05_ASPC2|nr:uncharacterized protein P168DRAFT_293965 [Aspergillus campestris IBT 28561]PKX99695.1 hypothetical protein P168DRAFT_293965 [Aspergillus campestris IBT 28561]
MGRKGTSSKSNALAVQVDAEGKVKYDAIARRGHSDDRIVHASFKDLIPLRQRVDMGEISLDRPSEEQVAEQMEKTKNALASLVDGAVQAQKPKNVKGGRHGSSTASMIRWSGLSLSIRRSPVAAFASASDFALPPRKLTAEDQEAWKIPPPVSNWKNPKGYTVPLDKRLAADGRGFAGCDYQRQVRAIRGGAVHGGSPRPRGGAGCVPRCSRSWPRRRRPRRRNICGRWLRRRARSARQLRQGGGGGGGGRASSRSVSRSPSPYYSSRSGVARTVRTRRPASGSSCVASGARRRSASCGSRAWARSGRSRRWRASRNRDISEKVALGLAKPTQVVGGHVGLATVNQNEAGWTRASTRITLTISHWAEGEGGIPRAADAETRDGPVQFEKDTADPDPDRELGRSATGSRRAEGRGSKRARVDEE